MIDVVSDADNIAWEGWVAREKDHNSVRNEEEDPRTNKIPPTLRTFLDQLRALPGSTSALLLVQQSKQIAAAGLTVSCKVVDNFIFVPPV